MIRKTIIQNIYKRKAKNNTMRKNLLLLTSITSLLITLTPSQALAQESTTPTSSSQSSSDKETDKRLPTDEKCHWKGETPVPENKYLKLLYDAAYKGHEETIDKIKNGEYTPRIKKLVSEGKMSDNEAQYRSALIHDRDLKNYFSSFLYSQGIDPLDPEVVKDIVNDAYDNPDNADVLVKEIMDSYSLKEYLEYVNKFVDPNIHVSYSSKELHDQYQKEFDELDKVIEYDKDDSGVWHFADKFKVTKLLDGFENDEDQINRFIQLRSWLKYFPTEDEINSDDYKKNSWGSASSTMINEFPELLKIIKEKDLDNDEFYDNAKKYLTENYDDWANELFNFLKEEYDINWKTVMSAKAYPILMLHYVQPVIENPNIEIPRDIVCDDEPEDTTTPTTTPVEDESETPTTPSTTDKEEPDTKTTSKEKPEEPVSEDNKDKEDKEDKENKDTTEEVPVSKEDSPVKPGNSITNPKPVQQGFTPVNTINPGTFNGGVSSTVEGEEISDGIKADTGSPTTSIINKIRTIF